MYPFQQHQVITFAQNIGDEHPSRPRIRKNAKLFFFRDFLLANVFKKNIFQELVELETLRVTFV